jgi:hypothetical protein
MNRNVTVIIAIAIVVIVAVLGYTMVQELQTRSTMSGMWDKLGEDDPAAFGKARAICDENLARALPMLVKATVDSSATRRRNAVGMLASFAADLKDRERIATDALVARLDDRDASVRAAACIALTADFRYKGAIEKLEAIADADPDITTRRAALTGLGYIAGDNEVLFLAAKLKSGAAPAGPEEAKEAEQIKNAASRALGLTGRADALMILLAQLREKESIPLQTEQMLSIAYLAGDLGAADLKEKVVKALAEYRAEKSIDALLIQSMSGPVTPAPEEQDGEIRALLGALLKACHAWGAGKEADFFIEKIKSAPDGERAMYEDVVRDYIVFLMQTGQFVSGRNVKVVADISDEDAALLLDICGKLIDLIGSRSNQFALDNLRLITGLNLGDDVIKWREQYAKWTTGAEKFKVEPLPEKDADKE